MKACLVAGAVCVALPVLAGLLHPGESRTQRSARRAADALPARDRIGQSVGVPGCAGTACHGQARRASGKIRRDEYRLWNVWDPHAHAYHVLEGQRAKKIIAHLARAGEFQEATRERRCLVCHTDPHLALNPGRDDLRAHGVSCESCHGPAGGWLDLHHAEQRPSREKLEQLGMKNLTRASVLAEVCAGCHVGSPPHEGQPGREVTHDFLAAGHPRLNFELTAYLANLPPHWNADEKARTRGRDFEVRAWAAGQVMAARASLQVLAYQARRNSPWPEFAAHDCESCHKPLSSRSKSSGKTIPMSRWYIALLSDVGAPFPGAAPRAAGVMDSLKELQQFLAMPQRNPLQVAAKADLAAAELADWGKSLEKWKGDPGSLMKNVGRHAPSDSWNWEEAAQRYLALSALEQSRHASGTSEKHQRIQNELLSLADKLAFPPSFSGPRDFSEAKLLDHFRRIREQLGK